MCSISTRYAIRARGRARAGAGRAFSGRPATFRQKDLDQSTRAKPIRVEGNERLTVPLTAFSFAMIPFTHHCCRVSSIGAGSKRVLTAVQGARWCSRRSIFREEFKGRFARPPSSVPAMSSICCRLCLGLASSCSVEQEFQLSAVVCGNAGARDRPKEGEAVLLAKTLSAYITRQFFRLVLRRLWPRC